MAKEYASRADVAEGLGRLDDHLARTQREFDPLLSEMRRVMRRMRYLIIGLYPVFAMGFAALYYFI